MVVAVVIVIVVAVVVVVGGGGGIPKLFHMLKEWRGTAKCEIV